MVMSALFYGMCLGKVRLIHVNIYGTLGIVF